MLSFRSYDLAPPPPPPPSHVSNLSPFISLSVCRWSSLLTGEGGGDGVGATHATPKKLVPLCIIQYPLVKMEAKR